MEGKVIREIEKILAKGDRIELVPGPGGSVKVIHIKRDIILNTKK